jgi:hypothetical protein
MDYHVPIRDYLKVGFGGFYFGGLVVKAVANILEVIFLGVLGIIEIVFYLIFKRNGK